jgi:peptidoglycan-associated lipoprotein
MGSFARKSERNSDLPPAAWSIRRNYRFVLVALVILLIFGCGAKTMQTSQLVIPPSRAPVPVRKNVSPVSNPPEIRKKEPAPAPSVMEDLYFDFDRAQVTSADRKSLDEDIRWLKDHPGESIRIEGHCDERGTDEYNLVLGEKRAAVAKKYIEAAGIGPSRITTVSYGVEKPFCDQHDEQCWRENRRDHFVARSAGD